MSHPDSGFINLNPNSTLARRHEEKSTLTQPSRKTYALTVGFILLGLLLISALLRLSMLTSQSLWLDEGASLAMTDRQTLAGTLAALWSIAGGDKYQITYFFLLTQWRLVVGDSQFALQLLSVIPGVLTPALIYLGLRRILGDHHAVLSALFIACSAFCVSYSQEVRPYAFLLCIASAQLWAFSPALGEQSNSRVRRLLFAFVTLISCMSSIFLCVFSASMAIAHLLVYRQLKAWMGWWIPAGAASFLALVYYLTTPSIGNVTVDAINTADTPLWANLVFALYGHIAGHSYGPSVNVLRDANEVNAILWAFSGTLILLLLACCVLAWHGLRYIRQASLNDRPCKPQLFFLILFLLALGGAACIAMLTPLNWMPRHSFYLMLPISVLLPVGLQSRPVKASGDYLVKPVTSATIAFTVILLINLYSNYNYFFKEEHWRDDYRSAAVFLEANVGNNDTSIMLWGEPYLLSYYGHDRVVSPWRLENPEQIMARINDLASKAEQSYVSINRKYSWARHSEELQSMLEKKYVLQPVKKFTNFSVYHLVERDVATVM